MESSHRTTQNDERIVIEAIFGDDAVFSKNYWKIWTPISVTIHLEPLHTGNSTESHVYVSADLQVKCSDTYPDSCPNLSIKSSKGISRNDIQELLDILKRKSEALLGKCMVLDLCDEVRNFLFDRNRPPAGSFHDGMVRNMQILGIETEHQRAKSEIREVEAVIEERERQRLEYEWKKDGEKLELMKDAITALEEDGDVRYILGNKVIISSDNTYVERNIHPFCKEWFGYFNSDHVLISEWNFQHTLGRRPLKLAVLNGFSTFLRKCEDLVALGESLCKLSEVEQSIVPYAFVLFDRVSVSPKNLNVKIYLAQKVAVEERCLSYNYDCLPKDSSSLRRLAASAVYAVRWLHDHKLTHGCLQAYSVWCDKTSFRFSDICLTRSLIQLCEHFDVLIGGNTAFGYDVEKIKTTGDLVDLGALLAELMVKLSPDQCREDSLTQLSCFINACKEADNVEELIYHSFLIHGLALLQSSNSPLSSHLVVQQDTRLSKEFVIVKFIGKGAFGSVVQARNKLDCNDYAVKCITLNHRSERLTREITREAKLFAKLNHINVVRYFNAWIEVITTSNLSVLEKDSTQPDVLQDVVAGDSILPSKIRNLDLDAKFLGAETSEWTASCRGQELCDSSDEESSSDGHNVAVPRYLKPDHSYSDVDILFQNGSDKDGSFSSYDAYSEKTSGAKSVSGHQPISVPSSRVLYIQMEYCEGGTLRKAIDSQRLVGNAGMRWRIFGEILSGLEYIHRQGMIHRDIKPMNILLDGNDHVKIGDFGLATRDLLLNRDSACSSISGAPDLGLTRDIGTEMYMAPELFDTNNSKPYTCKIDVYSLGIVLFEMCYRPLGIGMERIEIISNMKKLNRVPTDFETYLTPAQGKLARNLVEWMLKQNADERPSAEQLLKDDHIPLVDVEDKHFQKVFKQVLKKQSGRLYKWMMDAICKEEHPVSRCFCFDQDICKEKFISGRDNLLECLRDNLISIFRLHAFAPLHTHLLVPNSSNTNGFIKCMRSKPAYLFDPTGYSVILPVDLRLNFVRYCARNSINRMKRYTFDRVYAETGDARGVHPTERWECSVDCIGSNASSITLTASLLIVALEIASKTLGDYRCTLRIGHMGIINAAMAVVGMNPDIRTNVLQAFHDVETAPARNVVTKYEAIEKIIGEKASRTFLSFLPKDHAFSSFKEGLKNLTHSKDNVVREASRMAISEVERIAELLPNDINSTTILFDASLVYRPSTFGDGLVFHMACSIPVRKQNAFQSVSILAGGRYDDMLKKELHPHDVRPSHPLCLVGFTISLNALVDIKKKSNEIRSSCNALVCSYSEPFLLEKFDLAKLLRNVNISTDIVHDPVDVIHELLEHCLKFHILHLLVVFGRDDVLVISNGVDHGKMDFLAAVNLIKCHCEDGATGSSAAAKCTPTTVRTSASFANCILLYAISERPAVNVKKRIENQVRVLLSNVFSQFASTEKIAVIVTHLPVELIKTLAASLNRAISLEEMAHVFDAFDKAAGKFKQDVECVYKQLERVFASDRKLRPVVILFRQQDGFSRVIT